MINSDDDPLILIFPEKFFVFCFSFIASLYIIITISFDSVVLYRYIKYKNNSTG
ncbi:UNVERIFIED_CONTAM: hypothetical protein O8I53_09220 [Campylobacter lari]